MRWKADRNNGRFVRRFAWLPVRIDDEWLWFEFYEEKRTFKFESEIGPIYDYDYRKIDA